MQGGAPLRGIGVLDAGGAMSAYAARVLGDLGADVVVIEPPGGHELRRRPPFAHDREGPDAGLLFAYYHAGHRSVVLDTTSDETVDDLRRLAEGADVVLISPSPRAPLAGWDAETRTLAWVGDDTVVAAVTPFGLTGPGRDWRATPYTSFAMSGQMHRIGPPEGPPTALPGRQTWDDGALAGVIGVLAALHARPRAGGQLVDVSVHEVTAQRDYLIERFDVTATNDWGRKVMIGLPPTGTYQVRGGSFDVAAHQPGHWPAFLKMLDEPEELADPIYADPMVRRELHDALGAVIEGLLADRDLEDLVARGQDAGLPCGMLNTPAGFVADPQLEARGAIVPVEVPGIGEIRVPGPGYRAEPPLTVPRGPAPSLPGDIDGHGGGGEGGAGRPAVASGPASSAGGTGTAPAAQPTRAAGSDQGGALAGIRVLSFGAFVAGNTTAMILAELGAEAVKIEARSRPESLRGASYAIGPLFTEPSGITNTVMYASLSRNAQGLSLDMSVPAARDLYRRLASVADVVVENFGAGVMERWGCSYAELRAVNPKLVMVSLSGFGRTGPRAGYLAYASNISNFTGLTHTWNYSHGSYSDYITAAHAVTATLAALRRAEATGEGSHVDVAQIEAMAAVMPELVLEPLVNGRDVGPWDNDVPGSLLAGTYPASGPDTWVAVELDDLADWSALCRVLGRDDLDAADAAGAAAKRPALEEALRAWIAAHSSHAGVHLLQRHGIAAGVVQQLEDIWRDPQLRLRGAFTALDQPDIGPVLYCDSPLRLAATPGRDTRAGPRLGEHTDEVLRRWLGLADAERAALYESGAAFQEPGQ